MQALVQKGEPERRAWDKWTSWYLGQYWLDEQSYVAHDGSAVFEAPDSEELTLESNYPYAYLDTMIANIVPQNPRIKLNARVPDFKGAARARQALINDTIRAERLHVKAWECGLRTGICGRGFGKTVWDPKLRRPVTR